MKKYIKKETHTFNNDCDKYFNKLLAHHSSELLCLNFRLAEVQTKAENAILKNRKPTPQNIAWVLYHADEHKSMLKDDPHINQQLLGSLLKRKKVVEKLRPVLNLQTKNDHQIYEAIIKDAQEILEKHLTSNHEHLSVLARACLEIGALKLKNITCEEMYCFSVFATILRTAAHEALGYWTAKLGAMTINQNNARTRTVHSNANTAAITKILEALGIDDLSEFRANKELRNKFMEECRTATRELDKTKPPQPLSDERIMKKAREHIKARRFNIVLPAKATERPSKRR